MSKFKKDKKAILLIHGIAGGIFDLEELQRFLQLHDFNTFSYTLKGHDDYDNVDHITYKSWINQAEEMLNLLINNNYKIIYLVGHSMGGVLVSYLASKYIQVKKIVLLSPAFKYMIFKDNNFNLFQSIKEFPNIFEGYKKKQLISRFTRFPIYFVFEFIKLVDSLKNCIKKVKIPILIIHGKNDLIAPVESSLYVYNNCPSDNIKLIKLANVNHAILKNNKKNIIMNEINNFFNKNIKFKKQIIDK